MSQTNISGRRSRVLNRTPVEFFRTAELRHDHLRKDGSYSFDASIGSNGQAYDVYIPGELDEFYNLNNTDGPIYLLANTHNTTGKWTTYKERAEANYGWNQIRNEYGKQHPLIGKCVVSTILGPPVEISLDTSYVEEDEDVARNRFEDGDVNYNNERVFQDSILKLLDSHSLPISIENVLDGNGDPTRVRVREPDGTITYFEHQAWRNNG